LIKVSKLTRTFGSFTAVEDLNFELEKGEVAGFLGVNGAGKTTTMRMLTGFLPATRGSVVIAGFDVLRQSLEARRHIGYLPEGVPLYGEHRLREMLEFQGRLHHMPRKQLKQRIGEVLERVELSDRAEHLIGNLSKGLRQRAGLAVALLPSPDVLILDEPTSGLDPLQRASVRKLIEELAEEHTVLVSSHILPEIEAVCPRVIILHKGRIAASGTHAELMQEFKGESVVSLEAFMPDPDEAARLMGTIPGVDGVDQLERVGIHSVFRVRCESDMREDVGALAAAKGWALRELSFEQPNLERIFSRIAFEIDGPVGSGSRISNGPAAQPSSSGMIEIQNIPVLSELPVAQPTSPPKPGAPEKVVYNLNPFDLGRDRDLGQPKGTGTEAKDEEPS
jgi:ABC-2 type transport system ATP-binding protein